MARASSTTRLKKTFQVWYEYLKYAKKQNLDVSSDYAEWGDTSVSFKDWWASVGAALTSGGRVSVANSEHLHSEDYYVFAVPRHLSARQTRDQCEQLMKSLLLGTTRRLPELRWGIDSNQPVKLEFLRAYLRAMKCRDKLIRRGLSGTPVEILADMRVLYLDKFERYGEAAELMPQRLMHGDGGRVTDPAQIIVGNPEHLNDATSSVNAIREYLRLGEETLRDVAVGYFPGSLMQ